MNDQDVRLSELTEIILMYDAENSSERGTYYYASKLASMLMKRLAKKICARCIDRSGGQIMNPDTGTFDNLDAYPINQNDLELVQDNPEYAAALIGNYREMEKQRDRLLTLAVKWCDKSHHDWEEIRAIGDKCSFMDLRDSGGLSEEP